MKKESSIWFMLKKTKEYDNKFMPIQLLNAVIITMEVYIFAFIPKYIIMNIKNSNLMYCISTLMILIIVVAVCNFMGVECKRQCNWRSVALLHQFVEEKVAACYIALQVLHAGPEDTAWRESETTSSSGFAT